MRSNYTTTSATFVDIDATGLGATITTTGGDVIVHFDGHIFASGGNVSIEILVDGAVYATDDGVVRVPTSLSAHTSFTRKIGSLAAGSHTFKLQWKISAGTATLYTGQTTILTHPQFWVAEIS